MSYHVKTDKFQGPLDLLLQLIEEQKLPISEVSLAEVTQQFLDHIRGMGEINAQLLADFLTVATKLLIIKSKALLPALAEEFEEEEQGTDLAQQLLLYKKFKIIAAALRTQEAKDQYSFVKITRFNTITHFYPDPELTLERLAEAMGSVALALEEIIRLPQKVVAEVISITDKITELQGLISKKAEMSLSEAIKSGDKTETIVTFLALLELIKQRILSVEQESLFADIHIKRLDQIPPVNVNS